MVLQVGGWAGVPAQSTEVGAACSERVAASGQDERAGQQAQLVAGGVGDDPPRQLAPVGVQLAAAQLDDPRHARHPRRHPARAGCRGAAGSWRRRPWAPAPGTARAATPCPDGCRSAAGIATDGLPAGQLGPERRVARGVGAVQRQGGDRARRGVLGPLLHDAERVALGVGEHHPRHVALADVEVPRAEGEGALHHLGLAGAPADVEVQPRGSGATGSGTRWKHRSSTEPVGHGEPGLEGVGLVGERRRTPSSASQNRPSAARVVRVDDEVLEVHVPVRTTHGAGSGLRVHASRVSRRPAP